MGFYALVQIVSLQTPNKTYILNNICSDFCYVPADISRFKKNMINKLSPTHHSLQWLFIPYKSCKMRLVGRSPDQLVQVSGDFARWLPRLLLYVWLMNVPTFQRLHEIDRCHGRCGQEREAIHKHEDSSLFTLDEASAAAAAAALLELLWGFPGR